MSLLCPYSTYQDPYYSSYLHRNLITQTFLYWGRHAEVLSARGLQRKPKSKFSWLQIPVNFQQLELIEDGCMHANINSMYAYIHTYICIYIYIYFFIYSFIYVYVTLSLLFQCGTEVSQTSSCMCLCMHESICMYRHTCTMVQVFLAFGNTP